MLNLTHPRYVMPVHGDYKRMLLHGRARRGGRRAGRAHLPRRERPAAGDRRARRARGRPEPSGMVFVDGVDIGDVADVALRDRRMLSRGRHLHHRRHRLRAGRLVGRPAGGARARRAVPRRQREFVDELREAVEDSLDRAAEQRDDARSTCSSRCSTTTSRRSSTTGSSAARWCCRSSSRSEPASAGRRLTARAAEAAAVGRPRGLADRGSARGAAAARPAQATASTPTTSTHADAGDRERRRGRGERGDHAAEQEADARSSPTPGLEQPRHAGLEILRRRLLQRGHDAPPTARRCPARRAPRTRTPATALRDTRHAQVGDADRERWRAGSARRPTAAGRRGRAGCRARCRRPRRQQHAEAGLVRPQRLLARRRPRSARSA